MNLDLTNRGTLFRTLPRGGVVAEVGVLRGDFAAVILAENQPRELHLIDCWQRQPGTDFARLDPGSEAVDHDANYRCVQERFAGDSRARVMRRFSVDAASEFPDDCFDIVYLDGDHVRVSRDILAWYPKVRPGGWLCGHDYLVASWTFVKPAVDAFAADASVEVFATAERDLPSWAIRKPELPGVYVPARRFSDADRSQMKAIAGRYEYERVGYDRRVLALEPDGMVGEGVAACEVCWRVSEGRLVILAADNTITARCAQQPDGSWAGRWEHHERMPIALRPVPAKDRP